MSFKIAEAIVDLNLRVIPIKGDMKAPMIKGWPETQDRVEDWLKDNGGDLQFDEDEFHRYGIVLDDDMVVVDFDTHDGQANGFESYSELLGYGCDDILEHCGLIISSPSGGKHAFFRRDPNLKIPKNSKAFPAIDLLTKGAQVIGAGSNHVNGGEYVVEKWTGELTELGDEFFNWFRPKREDKPVEAPVPSVDDWDRGTGESPRDSFDKSRDAILILRQAMEAQGYVFFDKGDHLSYTRPNKTDMSFPVSGTLGRINRSGKYYLKNFSTSDGNFEADSYSLSEAYKVLNNYSNAELMQSLDQQGFTRSGDNFMETEFVQKFLESVGKGLSKKEKAENAKLTGAEIERQYPTVTLAQLREKTSNGKRRDYLIEGLLRRGEVMNIIAAPKVGKSWLVYNIALAVSCGESFLGYKAQKPLRVLIVDNELHAEELTWRVGEVADALGVDPEDRLQFSLLRGSNVDIDALDSKLEDAGGSEYDIIVIDAFYRILPQGMSENDNAAMTVIYNKLDALARKNEASIINIHHSSKGNQGDKNVTDVGAGAGSISRAADVHMVIRQHMEDNHVVIQAVTRSGLSPDPVTAEFDFPLWKHKVDMEPTLMSFENARDRMHKEKRDENAGKHDKIVDAVKKHTENGHTPNSTELYEELKLMTWGKDKTFKNHLKNLAKSGRIKELSPAAGSLAKRYTFLG